MSSGHSVSHRQMWGALQSAQRILIVIPKTPDGDNIGSSLALFLALRAEGKDVHLVTTGSIAPSWGFLPGIRDVHHDPLPLLERPWDLLIVTDVSDLPYAGIAPILDQLSPRPRLVNIDHHVTNLSFGDLNLVDPNAAAATEVVTAVLLAGRVSITPDIATCLLTGLVTDTGFFSNPATTDRALAAAALLIEHGARVRSLTVALTKTRDIPTLKFWGRVFERMRIHDDIGLAVTVIFEQELSDAGLPPEAAEGIANFLNILGNVRAVCILREDGAGCVKGSLRTTHPAVDVSRLALSLGGGGHKKAAGFTIPGRLVETSTGWSVV